MFYVSVFSYCHVHHVSAVLYTCYTDSMVYVDYETMITFSEILHTTHMKTFLGVRDCDLYK